MLRSIKQLYGNKLGASDGDLGHVQDFYFDDQNWAIGQLVIKTGHRLSGTEVLLPTKDVDRISYEASTVFATPTGAATAQSAASNLTPAGVTP